AAEPAFRPHWPTTLQLQRTERARPFAYACNTSSFLRTQVRYTAASCAASPVRFRCEISADCRGRDSDSLGAAARSDSGRVDTGGIHHAGGAAAAGNAFPGWWWHSLHQFVDAPIERERECIGILMPGRVAEWVGAAPIRHHHQHRDHDGNASGRKYNPPVPVTQPVQGQCQNRDDEGKHIHKAPMTEARSEFPCPPETVQRP